MASGIEHTQTFAQKKAAPPLPEYFIENIGRKLTVGLGPTLNGQAPLFDFDTSRKTRLIITEVGRELADKAMTNVLCDDLEHQMDLLGWRNFTASFIAAPYGEPDKGVGSLHFDALRVPGEEATFDRFVRTYYGTRTIFLPSPEEYGGQQDPALDAIAALEDSGRVCHIFSSSSTQHRAPFRGEEFNGQNDNGIRLMVTAEPIC